MKTAISLPDDLYSAAESLAGRLGLSRSRLYAIALEEYISRHQARRVTEKLNTVYSVESSDLEPGIAAEQRRTLKKAQW